MNLRTYFLILFCIIGTSKGFGQTGMINSFTLIDVKNNKQVSLSDFNDKAGIVVVFTSNYCPYSKIYEKRLKKYNEEYYEKGIQFLLINPNDPQKNRDDSIEEMAKRAKNKNYAFPYLADKDQTVSQMFNAKKTPEVFLITRQGDSYSIMYHGAIDDNPQIASDVSNYYLKEAIEATLKNKTPLVGYKRPTGCMIKN